MREDTRAQVARSVVRLRDGVYTADEDVVAAEEPLEIRLQWQTDGAVVKKSIAITMRTPGDDFSLAAGFLYGESIIGGIEDVVDIQYCVDEEPPQKFNIVTVTLRPGLVFDEGRLERHFYTTSSCGVCGKAALEALQNEGCRVLTSGLSVRPEVICALPETLRAAQVVFDRTGGLHAAGLFDAEGRLLDMREDVGRHNAVDKLIGEQVRLGTAGLEDRLLMLSGRASFELVQKALVARIPVVVSVGAPSSLAVELAESFGLTLAGFARRDGFNVYAGAGRIAGALGASSHPRL